MVAQSIAQTSTRIIGFDFDYLAPKTLEEALELLNTYKESGVGILAGGTDLLVKMKAEAVVPKRLMSIRHIPQLIFVETDSGMRIGAGVALATLEKNEKIKTMYSALFEAIKSMATPAIRNMATIGGNACNGSPAADTAPPLIVLGATFTIASKSKNRVLSVEEFFKGPGKTALSPGEMLLEIKLPDIKGNSGSSFVKMGRTACDISKVNVAVYLERDQNVCTNCRIVLGSVGATPLRVRHAEKKLADAEITKELVSEVAKAASNEITPITDARSTAEYRKQVSTIMVEEAIRGAWVRAGGTGW